MKELANITPAQLMQDGGSVDTLETMYSICVGNGTHPVTCEAGHPTGGGNGVLLNPGPGSALQAAIRYTAGVPVADIAGTASFNADGDFVPGVDVSTDHILVIWQHYPGDEDRAANSWN